MAFASHEQPCGKHDAPFAGARDGRAVLASCTNDHVLHGSDVPHHKNYGVTLSRSVGPIVIAYCISSLLIEAAVPNLIPENAITARMADAGRAGAFVVWFYLIWRIVNAIRGIYGPESAHYLEETPIWRILLDVTAAYAIAAFCFAILYVAISRRNAEAFSTSLTFGDALYFSVVTMTTTGYGDISPKLGLAKFFVCVQILFGFLYNVLFFSIFAGLAGRRRQN